MWPTAAIVARGIYDFGKGKRRHILTYDYLYRQVCDTKFGDALLLLHFFQTTLKAFLFYLMISSLRSTCITITDMTATLAYNLVLLTHHKCQRQFEACVAYPRQSVCKMLHEPIHVVYQ